MQDDDLKYRIFVQLKPPTIALHCRVKVDDACHLNRGYMKGCIDT